MRSNQKNESVPIRALDQELIDNLNKQLTKELSELIKELNDSAKIGAYGAMATLSSKVSEIAADIKKLQQIPTMLTNPFGMEDPRDVLDNISKKDRKKKAKK